MLGFKCLTLDQKWLQLAAEAAPHEYVMGEPSHPKVAANKLKLRLVTDCHQAAVRLYFRAAFGAEGSPCAFTKMVKRITKAVIHSKSFPHKLFRSIGHSDSQHGSSQIKREGSASPVLQRTFAVQAAFPHSYETKRREIESTLILHAVFLQNSLRFFAEKSRLFQSIHF